jgi:hypothetical protein
VRNTIQCCWWRWISAWVYLLESIIIILTFGLIEINLITLFITWKWKKMLKVKEVI